MTSYVWSSFPFDDACPYEEADKSTILEQYVGTHFLPDVNATVTVTSSSTEELYTFCDQDLIRNGFNILFFSSRQGDKKWMTPAQAIIANIFASTVVLVALYFVFILVQGALAAIKGFFVGTYKASGETNDTPFSSIDRGGYIPSVYIPGLVYPSLLCDCRAFEEKIEWTTSGGYDEHNLIYDIPWIRDMKDQEYAVNDSIFTIVKYYDPQATFENDALENDTLEDDTLENE